MNGLIATADVAADDGGVQTPVRREGLPPLRPVAAALVGDHGRPGKGRVPEYLVNAASATERGEQDERLAAFTEHGAACGGQRLHGGDARNGSDLYLGPGFSDGRGQIAEGGIDVRVADGGERDR